MKEKDRGKRSPPPSFPPDCLELLIVGGLTRQDFSSIVDLLPQFIMVGKFFACFFFLILFFFLQFYYLKPTSHQQWWTGLIHQHLQKIYIKNINAKVLNNFTEL